MALSFAPAPPLPPPPADPAPGLVELAEARYKAALKQYDETWTYYKQARIEVASVYVWSHFVLQAQFDLSDRKADQIAALEAHLDRMKRLETLIKKVRRLGFGQSIEVGAAEYYRLEAEYWIAHAKARGADF
jgi:hypothetical protein